MVVLHAQATGIVWDCGHFEQKNVVTLSKGNSFSSVIALNEQIPLFYSTGLKVSVIFFNLAKQEPCIAHVYVSYIQLHHSIFQLKLVQPRHEGMEGKICVILLDRNLNSDL